MRRRVPLPRPAGPSPLPVAPRRPVRDPPVSSPARSRETGALDLPPRALRRRTPRSAAGRPTGLPVIGSRYRACRRGIRTPDTQNLNLLLYPSELSLAFEAGFEPALTEFQSAALPLSYSNEVWFAARSSVQGWCPTWEHGSGRPAAPCGIHEPARKDERAGRLAIAAGQENCAVQHLRFGDP